jgi:hypothetical protein
VLALVTIDQRDPMATQSKLSAEHVATQGSPDSTLWVNQGQCGCHVLEDTRQGVPLPSQSDHYVGGVVDDECSEQFAEVGQL